MFNDSFSRRIQLKPENRHLQSKLKRLFIDIEKMIEAAMGILVNVSIFDTGKNY